MIGSRPGRSGGGSRERHHLRVRDDAGVSDEGQAAAGEGPLQRTARILRTQAQHCQQMDSPFYAGLLWLTADDLLAGGPAAAVLNGHLTDPGRSALALRMP